MVGGRQLVLMALPAVVALIYVLVRRPVRAGRAFRLRGLWLVMVALAVHVVRFELLPEEWSLSSSVGRAHGLVNLLCAGAFLILNRPAVSGGGSARWGLIASAGGVALNAVPVALVGAMPVSRSAALLAGFAPAEFATPSPGYVFAGDVGDPVAWFGDFVPVPGGLMVLSIGDVLLFAGFAVLIGLALASRLVAKQTQTLREEAQRT